MTHLHEMAAGTAARIGYHANIVSANRRRAPFQLRGEQNRSNCSAPVLASFLPARGPRILQISEDQKRHKPLINWHNFAFCESFCSKWPDSVLNHTAQHPDFSAQIEML
jgi:hypothetical protein